jgi:DNA-binding transcriptional ArsR family regulator
MLLYGFSCVRTMSQLEFQALTEYFRALSDRLRLQILLLLDGTGESNVSSLAERLGASQPLVSWHLRPLVRVGLVRLRRTGRETYCSLNRDAFRLYETTLARLFSLDEDKGDVRASKDSG